MTRTDNGRLRRALVEAAWSYRYHPAVKGDLAKRLDGTPTDVQTLPLKVQERLHYKYHHLVFG